MPTSQSASERERAAASSASSCSPGRSFANPSRIACFVIDEIQSRSTGFEIPEVSMMYAKISSPSRPASQALITRSTSLRARSLWIAAQSCFFALCASRGRSRNSSGTIGRSAMRHFLNFSSYSSGSTSSTEMADGERDDVIVGLPVRLLVGERLGERVDDVAGDGRLLCDD